LQYALPLYAVTLFISAFILFLVQPIVGKIILPKLGGTPQVWNTCMVFFQMVLLAGYAYTHNASTRLNLRQQLIAHAVLLVFPLIVLLPFPFAFGTTEIVDGVVVNPTSLWGFLPDLGSNPIPSTLKILFLYVALPFLVVATTAPLLQKWFAHTGHPAAKDPYFLYGASNLGSMLSLIVYPALIEPFVSLQHQGWVYTFGYLGLTVFVLACAAMVWNSKDPSLKLKELKPEPAAPAPPTPPVTPTEAQTAVTASAPPPAPAAASSGVKPGQPAKHGKPGAQKPHDAPAIAASDELTASRRLRWVLLAAIPSSLMLGITTHITTDLSPIPLFWLIPLILYLGSFILVFARWPVVWTEQPHVIFLYAQPAFIWLMIMIDVWNFTQNTAYLVFAIFAHVMGFFTTTMVCHGELAKDRASTKHLTEFYLWMSVGGMVGGMFNGLISPVVFKWGLWEFPLAIFAAVLVRPKMFDIGLLDNWIAGFFEGQAEAAPAHKPGHKGKHPSAPAARSVTANESLVQTLDYAWPIVILVLTAIMAMGLSGFIGNWGDSMFPSSRSRSRSEASTVITTIIIFGIPLGLAAISFARPLRIGLGVGAVLLMYQVYTYRNDSGSVFRDRSYFGAISVKESMARIEMGGKEVATFKYHQLIHGHINHGMNFVVPDKADRGDPVKDKSRLATTYYHREGPVGRVMEKYNWFSEGMPNTFHADARLPASVVGTLLGDSLSSAGPMGALVSAWSEPPICTVGLGTGTMASYGRPYQHVHFYEIDNQILRLSLVTQTSEITGGEWKNLIPDGTKLLPYNVQYKGLKDGSKYEDRVYFNYLEQAIDRGCTVQVLMGDARLRMALPYKNHYKKVEPGEMLGGGPDNFYHMMVVDAFSSDAIPAHLLTKQAFEMYFRKLTEEGILCVHTSNRFVDLPKVVAAVSSELGYSHLRGHDSIDSREAHDAGHFTSEWVMVARKAAYLEKLRDDKAFLNRYIAEMRRNNPDRTPEPYWGSTDIHRRYLWTDDYYNLLSVVRFGR
jgi:hypothetical protein